MTLKGNAGNLFGLSTDEKVKVEDHDIMNDEAKKTMDEEEARLLAHDQPTDKYKAGNLLRASTTEKVTTTRVEMTTAPRVPHLSVTQMRHPVPVISDWKTMKWRLSSISRTT